MSEIIIRNSSRSGLVRCAAAVLVLLLAACSDSNNNDDLPVIEPEPEPEVAVFQELFDQGVTRYMGQYTPMLSEADGDIVNHSFGAGDGPLCLAGGEYTMATLDAGSEDLVIFLQGGGGCWSEFCAATTVAAPGIPQVGILDPNRADNPVKDYSLAYFPYCDGGLHVSDRDTDSTGDGNIDRFQRGLHNLSAGLDVTVSAFPAPRRIVLMGASGGGLGTTFAFPLVRHLYPDVPIDIVNDSGIGVARPEQPEFLEMLLDDWNIHAFLPESCANCLAEDGHLSDYHVWQLDQDENARRAMLSYTRDTTFADFFLAIGKDAFEEALAIEIQQMGDAHPVRMQSWIAAGDGHTFVQANPDQTAGGVPLMEWLTAMLNQSDDWVSVKDE